MFEDLTVKIMNDHQGRQGGMGVGSGERGRGNTGLSRRDEAQRCGFRS